MHSRLLDSVLGGRHRSRSVGRQENEESSAPRPNEPEQPQSGESELPSYDESTSATSNTLSAGLGRVSLSTGGSASVESTITPPPAQPDEKKASAEPESSSTPQPSTAESSSQAWLQPPNETSAPSVLIRNPQSLLATALKFHKTLVSARSSSSTSKPFASFDEEPQIVTIHPHNQQVYLELLNHDAESFGENSISVKISQQHRNHWVSPVPTAFTPISEPFGTFSSSGSSGVNNTGIVPASATFHSTHVSPQHLNKSVQPTHYASPPAQPLRVPRLVIGPDILAFWSDATSSTLSAASNARNQYIHLLTVEGLSGPQIRKYLSIPTANAALSAVFQELANGYSVVFVALMLRDEWERSLQTEKRRFAQCGSVQRLTAYRDRDGGGRGDTGESLGLPPPGYAKRKEEERRDFGIMF